MVHSLFPAPELGKVKKNALGNAVEICKFSSNSAWMIFVGDICKETLICWMLLFLRCRSCDHSYYCWPSRAGQTGKQFDSVPVVSSLYSCSSLTFLGTRGAAALYCTCREDMTSLVHYFVTIKIQAEPAVAPLGVAKDKGSLLISVFILGLDTTETCCWPVLCGWDWCECKGCVDRLESVKW